MAQPLRPPCETQSGPSGKGECPAKHRIYVLVAAILGSSMVFIDGSALSVAIPALRSDLDASPAELNWIFNAYTLLLAALTLIGGAAADRYGARRVFLAGVAGFALASLACALAGSTETLIAARAAQGFFGALMTPASLAMIAAAYPEEERGAAIGTWAGASALTTAGGPVLGGWLVEAFSWQAIFFINLPLGALALAVGLRADLKAPRDKEGALDYAGAILVALALAALTFALVAFGEGAADPAEAVGALVAGLVLMSAFLWREHTAKTPMLPLEIFKSPAFAGVNLATLALYAALSIAFFALPIYLSDSRDWGATQIGLAFLPFTLGVGLLSRLFGNYAESWGLRRTMAGGIILAAIAFGLFAATLDGALGIYLPMGLAGLGFALIIPPLTATALSAAPDKLSGLASGVNNAAARTASMIGVALGAAFLAAGTQWPIVFAVAAALCALAALIVVVGLRSRSASPA